MKRPLREFARLERTLDLRNASDDKGNVIYLSDCSLAAGWYMIEASPDQVSIGSILTFKSFASRKSHQKTSQQNLQLGNSRVAKRLLWVREKSCRVEVSANSSLSLHKHVSIRLIRVTAAFARRRLLKVFGLNVTSAVAAGSTVTVEVDLATLYERYCQQCPTPDIATTYRHHPFESARLQAPVCNLSALTESQRASFHVIQTDAVNKQSQSQAIHTPFVVLTETAVCFSTAFGHILEVISNADTSADESVDLWYTDHDHVSDSGEHLYPCFKPAWNKGLLLHGNYIGPLLICRTAFFKRLGGMDTSSGNSAVFDFLLRCINEIDENSVHRFAQIGYSLPAVHYRHPHGFHVGGNDRQVVEAHVQRCASSRLSMRPGIYPGTWQVDYALPDSQPSVDILIPTRDRVDLLKQCVDSILSHTDYTNYTITVIDNDSCDPQTHDFHQRMVNTTRYRKIAYSGPFNYSAINNLAAFQSEASMLVLLNNDTQVVGSDWLRRIVSELTQDDVACVGARLLYPNGLLQHAGIVTGLHGIAGHVNRFADVSDHGYAAGIRLSADVSAVTGACLGIRQTVFRQLNGLNEVDLSVAYNDVDLCLRARNAGYRNRYLADVTLIHHESVSRGTDTDGAKLTRFRQEQEYMKRSHARWLADDPAWNPNFSRNDTTPTLIHPPTMQKQDNSDQAA